MDIHLFKNKIKNAIVECYLDKTITYPFDVIMQEFEDIVSDGNIDNYSKITRMTILFEGFYQSLSSDMLLKSKLLTVRLERWKNHFGTPTIEFLISFDNEIEQIKEIFNKKASFDTRPWSVLPTKKQKFNTENCIFQDEKSISKIPMPLKEEKKGEFIKTHNKIGGFTTVPSDSISLQYIEYIEKNRGSVVLEIGAAFGAATLQALSKNAIVYCNDIEPQNLAVIKNRYFKSESKKYEESNLVLLPGSFPDELSLPTKYFDAILISRVLHFFPGEKIDKSLSHFYKYLKPGGKLFIVCETPYLKNWVKFIPEYERRESSGLKWPGEITNSEIYEDSGFVATLPKFVHWISKNVLEKFLKEARFGIEQLTYIDRKGQFPSELLLDGRESVGAVAVKRF